MARAFRRLIKPVPCGYNTSVVMLTTTLVANVNTTLTAITNAMSGYSAANYDTLALDGSAVGNTVAGIIRDSTTGSLATGGYTKLAKQGAWLTRD